MTIGRMNMDLFTPPSPPPWRICLVNIEIKGMHPNSDTPAGPTPHVCIVSEDDVVVAVLGRYNPGQHDPIANLERTMADARAIASMPFLLDALFNCRDALAGMIAAEDRSRSDADRQKAINRHPAMVQAAAAIDMTVFGIGLPNRPMEKTPDDETRH